MDKRIDETIKRWQDFASRQEAAEKFRLNPDMAKVNLLADGVLNNEARHGLKFCPCRLNSGDAAADTKLICPCNFKLQKTWKEKGECWCSLFVKE